MTERQKRQECGERDLLTISRGEVSRRVYLSLTPTLTQALLFVGLLLSAMWAYQQ